MRQHFPVQNARYFFTHAQQFTKHWFSDGPLSVDIGSAHPEDVRIAKGVSWARPKKTGWHRRIN
jgi:hypothetical protein